MSSLHHAKIRSQRIQSAIIRQMIVEQLDFLGFSLDADKNIDGRIDVSILRINSDDDKQIYVILTDEQLELALSLEQAITIETNN